MDGRKAWGKIMNIARRALSVAYITGYFQPELGYHQYYLAREWAKQGHEVHIITSNRIYPFKGWEQIAADLGVPTSRSREVSVHEMEGFFVHRLPTIFEYSDFILVKGLAETIRSLGPDIVCITEARQGMTFWGGFWGRRVGSRLVYEHEQERIGRTVKGRLGYWLLQRFLIDFMVRNADVIVPVTKSAGSFLRAFHKAPLEKIFFSPYGADPEIFHFDQQERSAMRRKLNIRESSITIVSATKFYRMKGYDFLLDALEVMLDSGMRDFILLLIGNGEASYMDQLRNRVSESKLKKHVIFIPFLPPKELRRFYNASDLGIWLSPSITIIEAIACSLPILIPKIPSLEHLVEEGNGIMFEPTALDDLTSKMRNILSNPSGLQLMRAKARQAFEMQFSYEIIAKRLEKEFLKVLCDVRQH